MEQLNYRSDGVAGAVSQSSDQPVGTADAPNVQSSEPIREMKDSQLVGAQAPVSAGVSVSGGGFNSISAPVAGDSGTVKRKRGRPPRGQPPAKKVREDEEEDVCFICFDGGSLVLCDRRGCPKAYHPACIKRDEAFFQSKAKWNCGWHICSMCQKSAHHMCYTCTYSLCKGCIKKADYVCVRGDKGFCTICMKTIMLIENNVQGMEETPQVDFDDKTSWEYLFKVYWVYLKEKLSLTVDELTRAKNPWKGAGTVGFERISPEVRNGANDLKCLQNRANDLKSKQNGANDLKSLQNGANDIKNLQYGASAHENLTLDISPENLEANNTKRRKTDEHLNLLHEATLLLERPCGESGTSLVGSKKWATSELLEFVAHMRNGDTSPLSQFDVQNLVLEYIEKNNLRDPRLKTQVLCDSRLYNLFRKPCVGHFEMLKLLESHFLVKEDSQKNIVGTVAKQVDPDWNNDSTLMLDQDKKHKPCRKGEEQESQANLDEYAAIDVHNINLIYLRRDLVEILLEDSEKFHLKVVGSIVRISISSSDQKQDMYRLVQVVGTRKVDQPYKCGSRITNIVLEVLNLNKKETVSADSVSNQEFSEDECRHLRQSIRCGLVKQFTVGEILEKAVALQSVRFNDTPEERQHRLIEIPEVHADPKMNPDCASEEDAAELNNNKRGEYMKTRSSRNREIGAKSSSPQKRSEGSNETGDRQLYSENSIKAQGIQLNKINCYGSVTSASSLTMGNTTSANKGDTDELWHYQDPHGRVQGPFSLVQLQKWSTTGYFPTDMKIWASRQENSVLLTDALKGEFHKALPQCNTSLQSDGGGASNIQQSENAFTQRVSYQIDGTHGCSPLPSSALSVSNVGNNENQSDSPSLSGQSSGQNQKALPVVLGANNSNSDLGAAASVTKSTYVIEMNGAAVLSNLHNQTHKVSNDNWEGQVGQKDGHLSSVLPVRDSGILDLPSHEPKSSNNADVALNNQEKQSVPSKLVVQDSVPSWSTSSSLVVGGAQLAEIAHDWGRYPPIPAKPSSGEWSPGLASVPSMKLPESTADRVETSKSNIDQLIHSSPSQQRASTMSWQAMVSEPIEFSTLAEESVSDLLAEVDAMESSQCGLPSPTSKRNFVDELFYGSIEEFSPIPDQGARSDGFSSSGDMHLPCQSTTPEVGPSHGIVFDFLKRSEVDGEAKSSSAPVSHENKVVTHDAPRTSSEDILTSLTGVEKENKIRVDLNNVPAIIQHGRSGTSVPDCSVRADEEEGEIKSIDMPVEQKKFPEYIQPTAPLIISSNSVKPNTVVKAREKVTDVRNSTTIQQRGGNGRFKESVTGAAEEGEIKSTDISQPFQSAAASLTRRQEQVNQNNGQRAGLGSGKSTDISQPIQSAAQPLTRRQEQVDQNNAQRAGSGSGRQSHGNANPGSRGTVGAAGSQRKYSGDRYNGSPRDRGHNQSKGPWTRQSYGGAGGGGSGGGGHSRPSPKGRVCKFYESGRCKRGALCDYLHP